MKIHHEMIAHFCTGTLGIKGEKMGLLQKRRNNGHMIGYVSIVAEINNVTICCFKNPKNKKWQYEKQGQKMS